MLVWLDDDDAWGDVMAILTYVRREGWVVRSGAEQSSLMGVGRILFPLFLSLLVKGGRGGMGVM